MARIASLHFYPVKSCRGIAVDAFRLMDTGPEWDRRWMIVTEAGRRFISQRSHPAMATIAVAIDGRVLRLSSPGRAPLEVAVDHGGPSGPVTVWSSECLGVDAGDEAADWLSGVLGEPLRLVRQDPARQRLANRQYAGPDSHPVSFADAYPILMISRESLVELNRRLPAPIPMATRAATPASGHRVTRATVRASVREGVRGQDCDARGEQDESDGVVLHGAAAEARPMPHRPRASQSEFVAER